MAYYLALRGGKALLASTIDISSSDDFSIRFRMPRTANADFLRAFGSNSTSFSSRCLIFGGGRTRLTSSANANREWFLTYDISVDQELEFRRVSGSLNFFIDGVQQAGGFSGNTDALSIGSIGSNGTVTVSNDCDLYYFQVDINGSLVYDYDPSLSGGTGSTLTDAQSGNNGTLDGTYAWEFYEGGTPAINIDLPLLSSEALVYSSEVVNSLVIDANQVISEEEVFTPEALQSSILEFPLFAGTPQAYSPEILQGRLIETLTINPETEVFVFDIPDGTSIDLLTVQSETETYPFEILASKVLAVERTDASPEVYILSIAVPKFLDFTQVQSQEDIFTFLVTDSEGIVIPLESRETFNTIAEYLRTQGFSGNDNDVIYNWLMFEGYEGQINESLYKFWEDSGLVGTFNEKFYDWKNQ